MPTDSYGDVNWPAFALALLCAFAFVGFFWGIAKAESQWKERHENAINIDDYEGDTQQNYYLLVNDDGFKPTSNHAYEKGPLYADGGTVHENGYSDDDIYSSD